MAKKAFIVISTETDTIKVEDPVKILDTVCPSASFNNDTEIGFIKISGEVDDWLAVNNLADHFKAAFGDPGEISEDDIDIKKYVYADGEIAAHGVYVLHGIGSNANAGGSDVANRVKKIIIDKLGVDDSEVTTEASFTNDLGADSLDTVELIMEFEKEFDISIPDEEAEKIGTVGQAVDYVTANVA